MTRRFDNDGVVDSNEQNPHYTYNSSNTTKNYTINLTVTNDEGKNTIVKENYIQVNPATVLSSYNKIFVTVANDNGVKYNTYNETNNNTYYIGFSGIDRGLNANHISNNSSETFGQVTTTNNQSGVFYITDSGGSGFADNVLLMIAVNGTIPDNFKINIRSSGYNWTPLPGIEQIPSLSDIQYVGGAINETFTKNDFIYGPQTWKPCGNENYPIYYGQNMSDSNNTFQIMFIDLYVGVMNNSALIDSGAVKIEYSIENMADSVVFNSYEWMSNAHQGTSVVAWTNALVPSKTVSGFTVLPSAPVANFTCDILNGTAPLTVHFTDKSINSPTALAWDFDNDGVVDSTEQNPTYTYNSSGNYTVKLMASNGEGNDDEIKTDYISVSNSPSIANQTTISNYNKVYIQTVNDDGIAYNIFGNNTYLINFEGVDRGLNAIHISTDFLSEFGQITTTNNQSGVFYIIDSGGKHYEDEVILMLAVNGTIPDDFALHIVSSGYNWTPNTASNTAPDLSTITYQLVGINETFTKEDFIYGPQIWKPCGNENYPIYNGQNMDDTNNTFQIMFIDLHVGVLGSQFTSLINHGAVTVEYSFSNLNSAAVFNVYGYCNKSNNGNNMIAWSNRVLTNNSTGNHPSGYIVMANSETVVDFSSDNVSGTRPVVVSFKDNSTGNITSWAWDFDNDGVVDSTEQNPTYTYTSAGNYTVKLVVTDSEGSYEKIKTNYIIVSNPVIDSKAPNVTCNVNSGLFNRNIAVTLFAVDDMDVNPKIYYTVDGSDPRTSNSRVIYQGSVSIIKTTNLKFAAVDNANNWSPVYARSYVVDKTSPKVVYSYPKKYAKGVSRTSTLYIKFSEKLKASINWSKVIVKNKYGKTVKISKWISGNVLYIKTSSKRYSSSWYTIYIPSSVVKDYAGNNFSGYTLKFKTKR